jgi:hypothetical protein
VWVAHDDMNVARDLACVVGRNPAGSKLVDRSLVISSSTIASGIPQVYRTGTSSCVLHTAGPHVGPVIVGVMAAGGAGGSAGHSIGSCSSPIPARTSSSSERNLSLGATFGRTSIAWSSQDKAEATPATSNPPAHETRPHRQTMWR